MYSKKNPKDFILLGSGFDLYQAVMLFLDSKATFHASCPFFTELREITLNTSAIMIVQYFTEQQVLYTPIEMFIKLPVGNPEYVFRNIRASLPCGQNCDDRPFRFSFNLKDLSI